MDECDLSVFVALSVLRAINGVWTLHCKLLYNYDTNEKKKTPQGYMCIASPIIIAVRAFAMSAISSINQFLPVSAPLALLLKITRLVAPTFPSSAKCFCF